MACETLQLYGPTGKVILKIRLIQDGKIKVKVYANQKRQKQTLDFSVKNNVKRALIQIDENVRITPEKLKQQLSMKTPEGQNHRGPKPEKAYIEERRAFRKIAPARLTCVGNSIEWSKNAGGNSMGGVEKNGVPQRGGGADIDWNSLLPT